jgi:glycine/D-amino acid oxidase-like deaminating enzyme
MIFNLRVFFLIRIDEFNYQMSRQGWNIAPQCLMTPEQIKERIPIMDMDTIVGGLYSPHDGYVDPYSVTQAIAAGARDAIHQCFRIILNSDSKRDS